MTISYQPAAQFSFAILSRLINSAFTGYVGGLVQFTPELLVNFLVQGGVNLNLSIVAVRDEEPAGIAMIARRGWTSRVAMMGVAQEMQNQGIGRRLMQVAIDQARAREDRTLTLEVIEQNPRAVHLYESLGFRSLRRLTGYNGESLTGETLPIEPVDVAEVARRITAWAAPDLPWPCSGESLIAFGAPSVGCQICDCFAAISKPEAPRIVIRGLAVPPQQQRQGWGTRVVSALLAAFPDRQWHVSATSPEEFGRLFTANGFTLDTINQFQMLLTL